MGTIIVFSVVTAYWVWLSLGMKLWASLGDVAGERDAIVSGVPDETMQILVVNASDHTEILFSTPQLRRKLFPETTTMVMDD